MSTRSCRRLAATVVAAAALVPSAFAGETSQGRSVAAERCFGAAARDPLQPCRNPRLEHTVVPRPSVAGRLPNAPCELIATPSALSVCAFGTDESRAQRTIALVGDSHAGHWRAALDAVARRRGWRGLSITHTSCPLSKAVRNLADPARFRACAQWKRSVFAWFAEHPQVRTVFVAGLSAGAGVVPRRGKGRFETAVDGYVAAWRALPRSVEQIVVIRDTPKMRGPVEPCLARAIALRRPAGRACAVPRRRALDRDPLMAAAARIRSPRVRTVDLTRFFCGPGSCYPVIGGALVLRDQNHMTPTFAATLGPYLLRALARVVPQPAGAAAACLGAAARDPQRRCRVDARSLRVVPNPRNAPTAPSARCRTVERSGELDVCAFGAAPDRAVATVALIGDSHAAHWRGALGVVAEREGWRALSIMRGGCPLSTALRNLQPASRRDACAEWKRQVFQWVTRHPEVGTVFVSGLSGGTGVVPEGASSEFETSVAGYRGAWRALPATVERIVVIRDTPKMRGRRIACVERAMARGRPPGAACALPRRRAFDPDPIVEAARRERSSRVRLVDLTRFFCGRRRCYPVIGGVLVCKDSTHLTAAFSRTLGPYLLRAVARVL
jgi:hypothetical protein